MFNLINVLRGFENRNEDFKESLKLYFPELDLSPEGKEYLKGRPIPQRKTSFSAAYDLGLPYSVDLQPGEMKAVTFGWVAELLDEDMDPSIAFKAFVTARSSLYKKKGLLLAEPIYSFDDGDLLQVVLFNISSYPVHIEAEECIAQVFFARNSLPAISFDTSNIYPVSSSDANLVLKGSMERFYFQLPENTTLKSKEFQIIKSGLKWQVAEDEFILISLFTQDNGYLKLANGVGIVDSDYFDNPDNEGEIGFPLLNTGYIPIDLSRGKILGVGIVVKYFTIDNDIAAGKRVGGFGSTDKEA